MPPIAAPSTIVLCLFCKMSPGFCRQMSRVYTWRDKHLPSVCTIQANILGDISFRAVYIACRVIEPRTLLEFSGEQTARSSCASTVATDRPLHKHISRMVLVR